jgi:hypothetical protein
MSDETKAFVTVSEMARMVGLSRARFYQLQKAGVFPAPVYRSGRPVYSEPLQQVCLEVRRTNRGANGEPVLFYGRQRKPAKRIPRPTKPTPNKDVQALLDGLNALGLTTATAAQVQEVARELFPKGTTGLDQAEVLRAVFLHLKRGGQGKSGPGATSD